MQKAEQRRLMNTGSFMVFAAAGLNPFLSFFLREDGVDSEHAKCNAQCHLLFKSEIFLAVLCG